MLRRVKIAFLCWVIGYLVTVWILYLKESNPRLHRILSYPLFRVLEMAGVSKQDLGSIPFLILSSFLYGGVLIGCGWLAMLGVRKFRGTQI